MNFSFVRSGTAFSTLVIFSIISRARQSQFKRCWYHSVRTGEGVRSSGNSTCRKRLRLAPIIAKDSDNIDLLLLRNIKTVVHGCEE